MTGLPCRGVRAILHRERTVLSDADRLAIEEHLSNCGACRAEVETIEGIRCLIARAPVRPLGPRGHARAIERAFTLAAAREAHPATRRRLRPVLVTAGTMAAVAGAVAIVLVARGRDQTAETRAVPAAAQRESGTRRTADTLVTGAVSADGAELAPGSHVPTARPIRSETISTLSLGPSTVTLSAGATIVWKPDGATLDLREGAVDVVVDPARRESFRVATASFAVEVVGTDFTVTADQVTVRRGAVRIVGPDGAVLVDPLSAGEAWGREEPTEAEEARSPAEPQPARPAATTRPAPTASDRLSEARRAFVAGDIELAASAARNVLAMRAATRGQSADAHTLLAECAQAAGHPAQAISLYRRIAEDYRDLPAGETALFAAGRLEANRGHKAPARGHLELYLRRYPQGRFVSDARARLRALGDR